MTLCGLGVGCSRAPSLRPASRFFDKLQSRYQSHRGTPTSTQIPALIPKYQRRHSRSLQTVIYNPVPRRSISIIPGMQSSNEKYAASFGEKAQLPAPPAKRVAILTCMDARIDPAASLGLAEGDAHVIRNAGGRASEALRSLVISQQLLGTRQIMVFHHTGCGMLTTTEEEAKEVIRKNLPSDEVAPATLDSLALLNFSDLEGSVLEDVDFLKTHPLIHAESDITGWVYEVETGKIRQVV